MLFISYNHIMILTLFSVNVLPIQGMRSIDPVLAIDNQSIICQCVIATFISEK